MFKNLKSGGVFKHFLLATTFVTSISYAGMSNLSASAAASASSAGGIPTATEVAAMQGVIDSLAPLPGAAASAERLQSPAEQDKFRLETLALVKRLKIPVSEDSVAGAVRALLDERVRLAGVIVEINAMETGSTATGTSSVTSPDRRDATYLLGKKARAVQRRLASEGAFAPGSPADLALPMADAESDLERANREENETLRAELDESQTTRRAAESKLAEVTAALETLQETALVAAATAEREIATLAASDTAKASELDDLRRQLAILRATKQRLEAATTTHSGEIDTLHAEMATADRRIEELTAGNTAKAAELATLRSQLTELREVKRLLEQEKQEQEQSYKDALSVADRAKAEAEEVLTAKTATFEREAMRIAAELEDARSKAIAAQTQHEKDIVSAKAELLAEQREIARGFLAEAAQKHKRDLIEIQERLSRESTEALARQKEELTTAYGAQVRDVERTAQQKHEALAVKHAEALAKLAHEGGGAVSEALAEQKRSLEAAHAREFARIQDESSLALAAANKANVQALSDLKHRLDSEKEEALTALSEEHSLYIAQIRSEFAAEKEALERTTEDKIEAAKQELSKRLETATGSAEDQLVPLRAEIEEARKDLKRTQMEARSLTARLRALASERDELKGATTQLAADIEAAKSKHTAEMTSEREAARRIEQETAQKLTEQKEHHAKECEDLQAKNAALKVQVGDAREAQELETHRAHAFQNSLGDAEDGISTIADVAGVLVPTTDDAGSPAEDWVSHVVGNLRSLLERVLPDYGTARAHAGVNEGDLLAVAVEGLVRDQTDARDAAARLRSRLGGDEAPPLSALASNVLSQLAAEEDKSKALEEERGATLRVLSSFAGRTANEKAELALATLTRYLGERDAARTLGDAQATRLDSLNVEMRRMKESDETVRQAVSSALSESDVLADVSTLGLVEALISQAHPQERETLIASSASAAGMAKDGSIQDRPRKASRRSHQTAALLEDEDTSNPCCVCFGATCC